jgi:hypothetical protein
LLFGQGRLGFIKLFSGLLGLLSKRIQSVLKRNNSGFVPQRLQGILRLV